MHPPEQVDPAVLANGSRTLWLIIAAMAAAVVVSYRATGLSVDILSNPALLGSFPVLGAIIWVYRSLRPSQHLACAMETTTQLLLVLLFGILLTYAAIAAGYPYRDAELHGVDQWIGFDRSSYLAFIKAHHWLSHSFTFAYLSLHIQTALIPLAVVIAATPVDGAHYFVDVIGGSAVALIAVWLGAYLLGPRRRRARSSMPVENPGTMASV